MEFLHRHKRLFLAFGITICLGAIVVTVTGVAPSSYFGRAFSYVVVPMQRGVSSATAWVGGRISILAQSAEILAENQALREENTRLQNELARLGPIEEENIQFHIMSQMSRRYPHLPMIGARIIGQNPNDWQASFNIDRGERRGASTNMVVLGDGGLLGVIRETGPFHSMVVSIMDNDFAAAVFNVRTEDLGVVKGDLVLAQDGLMRMVHIIDTARFMPGDEIRTSAHGAIFPPGILVGTVVSVHPSPEGLTQYAIIQPAVNLDRVDIVWVVDYVFDDDTGTYDEG